MRHATLEKVAIETRSRLQSLKSCSTTRWACKSEAVSSVKNNYDILIVAIEEICKNCIVPSMRAKGVNLLHQLQSFEFVFGLYLMDPILKLILKVSSSLQSPKLDLLSAVNSIQALKHSLMSMRNDTFFKEIFERVTTKCNELEINIPEVKQNKMSKRIDNNTSNQFVYDSKYEELRCSVFNILLDNLIGSIEKRFKQDTLNLISSVGNLLKLELNDSSDILSKMFNVSISELEAEVKILKHMPDKPIGTSSESIYVWLDWLNDCGRIEIFNNMYQTLKMFVIIPVTSCTCERVFSKLSIVKSKLRTTMAQDRLESLMLLFTEQEFACKLDYNDIINEFINFVLIKRRLPL